MSVTGGQFWAFSFRKTDGSPYSGVRVFHYDAGTTTDADVWQDELKTNQATQPVVGNTNGVVQFYGDNIYRLVVKAAVEDGGATLHDWDSVKILGTTATLRAENQGLSYPNATTANKGQLFARTDTNGDVVSVGIQAGSEFKSMLFESQAVTSTIQWHEGANLATAATITLGNDGNFFVVTGNVNVTSLTTYQAGAIIFLRFTGTPTLVHNATSFALAGSMDYPCVGGELFSFLSLGSGNWMEFSRNVAVGDFVGRVALAAGTTVPHGWFLLDGSAKSRTTYNRLYTLAGANWGAGDGSTTFEVHDFRGRGIVMPDGGAGRITADNTLGNYGGSETHTNSIAEMALHGHPYRGVSGTGSGNAGFLQDLRDTLVEEPAHTGSPAGVDGDFIGGEGGGAAYNIMNPYGNLNMMVRW